MMSRVGRAGVFAGSLALACLVGATVQYYIEEGPPNVLLLIGACGLSIYSLTRTYRNARMTARVILSLSALVLSLVALGWFFVRFGVELTFVLWGSKIGF